MKSAGQYPKKGENKKCLFPPVLVIAKYLIKSHVKPSKVFWRTYQMIQDKILAWISLISDYLN